MKKSGGAFAFSLFVFVVLFSTVAGCGSGGGGTTPPSNQSPVPSVTSVQPSTIAAGSAATEVLINGTGFMTTSSVTVNGNAVAATYKSATQLSISLSAGDLANMTTLSIVVSNPAPAGGSSSAASLVIGNPVPVVSSVSPTSVTEGAAAFTLDVKGTGFVPSSAVNWNTTTLTTTFVSSTELTASVPASLVAASGSAQVVVVNPTPAGGQSAVTNFTVLAPKPVLSALSPTTVESNQAATIKLIGSGFDSHSVVQWNANPRPTTFISSTQLSVSLTAADLATVGTGQLTVINGAPGGGMSLPIHLNITNLPLPTITSVSLSVGTGSTGCPQIQVHVVGTNFYGAYISVNGQDLQGNYTGTDAFGFLPPGFSAAPGNFTVVIKESYPPATTDPYSLPASVPPVLAICAQPTNADIYSGSKFLLTVLPSAVNTAAQAALNRLTLPAGITTGSATPINLDAKGTRVVFKADSTLAAGPVSIPYTATAGTATASGAFTLAVMSSAAPGFFFPSPLFRELGVPIGGSGSISFSSSGGYPPPDYTVDLAASGLPSGTTATITPSTIIPGDNFTVTVNAASNAPVSQNVPVTVTGTPSAAVSSASMQFTLDVTQPPGSLPGNRTDFVSTGATPYAVLYDRQKDLVFASNPGWNRIDVLSNRTHQVIRSIPIRGPQAIDLTQDGSTLWIGTNSVQIYSLDTTTFALTRYLGPLVNGSAWQSQSMLALADGTLLIGTTPYEGSGITNGMVWNPATNQSTAVPSLSIRNGDGTKAYGSYYASGYTNSVYDVATKSVTTMPALGQNAAIIAVNHDGSRIVANDEKMYDASGSLIGSLPSYLGNSYYSNFGATVFSPDGSSLYQIGSGVSGSFIATIDVATLSLKGTAPALAMLPNMVSETPITTGDCAVDNTGVLIGAQLSGVGFEDSTFFQNFGTGPINPGTPVTISPRDGLLSGGTTSQPYGAYDLVPDVWYGANRGSASLDSTNSLAIVSPPGNADGPVNLKFLYPSGIMDFAPNAFSYSAWPQYSILSGAPPEGNVPGRISGYGMPGDGSQSTLTIGGNTATITTTIGQYPPWTQEAFPSTYFDYVIPPGNPGYADLSLSTPIGGGTLPKAVFYAQSVTNYSVADTGTDVLYDPVHQQVYLSGTDHVDVFSMSSKQWVTPLKPTGLGAQSQFRGMALTPDGTQLLATNILNNSLTVFNLATPSQTFTIPMPATSFLVDPKCGTGPFAVAAVAGHRALVSSGLPPTIGGCPYNETLFIVDLVSRSVSPAPSTFPPNCGSDGSINEASADGTLAIVGAEEGGACIYSSATGTFTPVHSFVADFYGIAMSGDANIASIGNSFVDPAGNSIGTITFPVVLFPGLQSTPFLNTMYPPNALLHPRLNASGSLYYWAGPTWFEIYDVQRGMLQLRFSLNQTIQAVETPLAIDPSGEFVFLITDAGLTIVDLGTAPLSVGSLSATTASVGTKITVRGSGFTSGISATLGGQSASVTLVDASTLEFSVPSLSSGVYDLNLTRSDGSSYTLVSAVKIP